ncbi:MAG TPA: NAD(P)(+) transhydrogenase (Re/Si-specific) subunit beta [Thermoanaerobaculia bacterium]|nr:NAD(P)(+) transhydrogenase (Re/Si-specific) subunit beta [Thermoanaerobaculia bacterium]
MNPDFIQFLYLISAALFILGLKGLTKVKTARRGNAISALGMLIAIVATLLELGLVDFRWIIYGLIVGSIIGAFAAIRVQMTEMPEMVALFNGFGGAASALVAISTIYLTMVEGSRLETMAAAMGGDSAVNVALSILIGGVTFSGSIVAYLKLRGKLRGEPILIPGRHLINAALFGGGLIVGLWAAFVPDAPALLVLACWLLLVVSLVLGVMLVIPIGGADMPVVISLLNSYSGIAAAATGFVIGNAMLIVAGALVGASGLILTRIMCIAMNRSLTNVVFGGFGAVPEGAGGAKSEYGPVRSGGAEEAAMLLDAAERVMVVPGYGLAVAQAQHTVREMADLLEKKGCRVEYAIHPVAGRMPGHMNVLLAEADVPYDRLLDMEQANAEFRDVDVVLVVGANDVVNPAAEKDPSSPIAGMPILQTYNARSVIVIKRSLGAGFANIKNELFEYPQTMMVFMDAKKAIQEIVSELKQAQAA